MVELTKQPVVIEHQSNSQKNTQQEKKQGYIKDSASKVKTIAQIHGLDALLQAELPAKSALERAQQREQRHKEQRQKNLEQILKLAHSSCRDEAAGEPDQDWLHRFFEMAQDIHNSHESIENTQRYVTKRSANSTKSRLSGVQFWRGLQPKTTDWL